MSPDGPSIVVGRPVSAPAVRERYIPNASPCGGDAATHIARTAARLLSVWPLPFGTATLATPRRASRRSVSEPVRVVGVMAPQKRRGMSRAAIPTDSAEASIADPDLFAKAVRIHEVLEGLYSTPVLPIPLIHSSNFQLLCAVMMSAQTTDVKVNEVTPELFEKFGDPVRMAEADTKDVEGIIKYVGLAPTKSKNLVKMAQLLLDRHGGHVPDTFDELEALPGVGHKTASVVMAQAFGIPAFPVDTHIHRLAWRWGLSEGKNVVQVEEDLKKIFPRDSWARLHLQIIFFGREYCPALSHDLASCPICSFAAVPEAHLHSSPKAKEKAAVGERKLKSAASSPLGKKGEVTSASSPSPPSSTKRVRRKL